MTKKAGALLLLIPAVTLLSACGPGAPASAKSAPPAFVHRPLAAPESAALLAANGAPVLFTLPASVRPRGFARTGNGFVWWDSAAQRLVRSDSAGKETASWPLEAAFVWTDGKRALARGSAYTEGSGFTFTLYRLDPEQPRKLGTYDLDCFPSDLLFSGGGSVFLAGGTGNNRENRVYRIGKKRNAEMILASPQTGGFLRLVGLGEAVLVFESGREKAVGNLAVTVISGVESAGSESRTGRPEGLPPGALCWYGYGFRFAGEPVLPLALDDGSVALARLGSCGTGWRLVSLAGNAGGCIQALGESPEGSGGQSFSYYAHDVLADPGQYSLGFYDGCRARLEPLP